MINNEFAKMFIGALYFKDSIFKDIEDRNFNMKDHSIY